jgi:hypothetical protein
MIKRCFPLIALAALAGPLGAVYAPIPEEELGKALVVRLGGGFYHDSNIFGSPTAERDSMVYRFAPSISYNASVTDQTFLSASYDLMWDYVEDRPENQDLVSHILALRLAHSFSPDTILDINETFSIIENPESLLPGLPLNSDQSYTSNQFDVTFDDKAGERIGYTLKGRSLLYAYDLDSLARQLDRHEFLVGASLNYDVSEATQVLGELRYLDVSYDQNGAFKDKQSTYFLAGLDYNPSETLALSIRAGLEQRDRSGAPDDDAPHAEVTFRKNYGERSFFSAGYMLAIEEISNVAQYTDIEVHRFFANVQHAFAANTTGSLFYNVEPSKLLRRPGLGPDRDETTQRFGAALTFQPRRGWMISGTFDVDVTDSDDPFRDLDRTRVGIDVSYSF